MVSTRGIAAEAPLLILDVSLQLRSLARTMLSMNVNPAQGRGLMLSSTGTPLAEPVKYSC